jgi:ferredoxin-NADP reductase
MIFSRLDAVLGRVTMYRLVSLILAALALVSIVLSLFGAIAYPPLDLLASLVTALVASVVANRLVALAFRVRPHSESSIITGLLLFFVLFPTSEPGQLLILALTAAIAMASKYVLAWRGRHLFNPAAIAVVIITLLQLSASAWWVGTGPLLPFVAVGALVVLYRTRQLPMALVFVVLSAGIVTGRLVVAGQAPLDSLTTALTSYPIVFLAGFMLSEPLTLPPRRWQRLVLAAVVALLFAIPFNFGPVFSSPELALVLGNILAFAFARRRGLSLRFTGKTALTPTATEFSFATTHPVAFAPGQYMELTLPHSKADFRGTRRVFSLTSSPAESGEVRFGVTMGEELSSFKRSLNELEPDQQVRATLVSGDFVLPSRTGTPVLLVAGGIGITPFISQLAHAAHGVQAGGQQRDIVLAYAVRDAEQLAFAERLETLGTRVIVFSAEDPGALPSGWTYAGTGQRMTAEAIAEFVPDLGTRAAFVSGPPRLVGELRSALKKAGVSRIKTDAFSGY